MSSCSSGETLTTQRQGKCLRQREVPPARVRVCERVLSTAVHDLLIVFYQIMQV